MVSIQHSCPTFIWHWCNRAFVTRLLSSTNLRRLIVYDIMPSLNNVVVLMSPQWPVACLRLQLSIKAGRVKASRWQHLPDTSAATLQLHLKSLSDDRGSHIPRQQIKSWNNPFVLNNPMTRQVIWEIPRNINRVKKTGQPFFITALKFRSWQSLARDDNLIQNFIMLIFYFHCSNFFNSTECSDFLFEKCCRK